jgi:hypothetical protein
VIKKALILFLVLLSPPCACNRQEDYKRAGVRTAHSGCIPRCLMLMDLVHLAVALAGGRFFAGPAAVEGGLSPSETLD